MHKRGEKHKPKPLKIGLCLSSGAARGLAHIGILKALEDAGIKIDYISGSSMGAAVAALYASGLSAKRIESIVKETDWKALADFTIPKKGLIAGKNLEKLIRKVMGDIEFKDLKIPLAVIATDLKRSKKVVFTTGSVVKAVRASISIPAVFDPVRIDHHELVDGGIVNPVPIDSLIEMGADIIIAVDITLDLEEAYVSGNKIVEDGSFLALLKNEFVESEVKIVKDIVKEKWLKSPKFLINVRDSIIDAVLSPVRAARLLSNKNPPHIIMVLLQSINTLANQLAIHELQDKRIDLIIKPKLKRVAWTDFDKIPYIISEGEDSARKMIPKLREIINEKSKAAL